MIAMTAAVAEAEGRNAPDFGTICAGCIERRQANSGNEADHVNHLRETGTVEEFASDHRDRHWRVPERFLGLAGRDDNVVRGFARACPGIRIGLLRQGGSDRQDHRSGCQQNAF